MMFWGKHLQGQMVKIMFSEKFNSQGFATGVARHKTQKITKREAEACGHPVYFGVTCKNGHEGWRYTATANCIECARKRRLKKRYGIGEGRSALLKAESLRESMEIDRLANSYDYDF